MFNSINYQSTSADCHSSNFSQLIATGVIVHDNNRDRFAWPYRLWQYLMHHLLHGDEPRIWQKCNVAGEVFYHGYDPRSRRLIHCATKTELRAWLDQLPYF